MNSVISCNSYQHLSTSQIMGMARYTSNIATGFYANCPFSSLGQSLRRVFSALGELHKTIEKDLGAFPAYSAHWADIAYSRLDPGENHRSQLIAQVIELEKLQKSTQLAAIKAADSERLRKTLASHTATLQILIDQLTALMPADTSYTVTTRSAEHAQQ